MKTENSPNLTALRENAGLTVRELARQLNIHHTTVLKWEQSGRVAKSEYLVPVSEILGISIEALLGLPERSAAAPSGRALQAFTEVSRLPRPKQNKILDVVDALIKA